MWERCVVEKEHINKGKIGEGDCCAIALAMENHSEFTDDYMGVAVGDGTLDFVIPGSNRDDGYANQTVALKIHPEDYENFRWFINEFDMIETDEDREYLQEFSFRWRF